jgi:hypothetical protein
MLVRKAKIDPRVRAKFKKLGVDAARSQLAGVIAVRTFDQKDMKEVRLGDGLMASGREMTEWLDEQAARERCWLRAGVIIAGLAALFALAAWLLLRH